MISLVISPLIWVITMAPVRITKLITTLTVTLVSKPYRTLKGTLNPCTPLVFLP